MCPGNTDFKVAAQGKLAFEEIGASEIVGFVTCGGCPGKKAAPRAKLMVERGAEVVLVSGPTKEALEHPNLKLIKVNSAIEMLEQVQEFFPSMNGGVFSAAVSDYRPVSTSDKKIKKESDHIVLELIKNPDILKWCGDNKKSNQWLCGFALETNNEEENALSKRKRKNLDFIVLNTLNDFGAGFGHDTNKIYIFDKDNNKTEFELLTKVEVAKRIIDYIVNK